MKRRIYLGLAFVSLLAACESAPKSHQAEANAAQEVKEITTDATKLAVDTQTSIVTWVGTKATGKHNGTFNITEGNIAIKDAQIVGGNFTIDVASVKVLDIPAKDEGNGKLVGHLKDADFFDAAKFPTAKFEIVKVESYKGDSSKVAEKEAEYMLTDPSHTVTGNLTLKGVTKSITFPAKIVINNKKVEAEAKFNINRKDWNINYGADESLGDKFIRPNVHIGFDIVTK